MPENIPPTVLVVEDHPDVRASLEMLLTISGYQTADASNGQEALNYLRDNPPPSLILLDLRMPVMSGIEFLRRRKLDPALSAVPVLVCSGEASGEQEAAFYGTGYCRKADDPREILRAVARYCGGSSAGQAT